MSTEFVSSVESLNLPIMIHTVPGGLPVAAVKVETQSDLMDLIANLNAEGISIKLIRFVQVHDGYLVYHL